MYVRYNYGRNPGIIHQQIYQPVPLNMPALFNVLSWLSLMVEETILSSTTLFTLMYLFMYNDFYP